MFGKFFVLGLAALTFGFLTAGCSSNSDKVDTNNKSSMAPGDIIDVATGPNMDQVSTLVTAVKAAGLVDTLKGAGPYTVFAPTNAAFAKLPPGTLDDLLKPENKEKLKNILLYHVVLGTHLSNELSTMKSVNSVQGGPIKISLSADQRITVGNSNATASVIRADIPATNGVIHWVDTVMMP